MSTLKKTWLIAGGSGLWYLWLKAAAENGVGFAENITGVVDSVASETVNILQGTFSEIGSMAPVAQNFIDEMSSMLASTSLMDAGIAAWVGVAGWWLWKKWSQALGKVIWVESDHDNNVSKVWMGLASGIWVLWASASAITIGSGTAGYVLWRKLWEKILGEKYAKITGLVWAAGWVGLALWASSWTILWLGATVAGIGLVWKGLWVGDNWSKQNTRRKNEGVLKTHFWIGRWNKSKGS